MALCHLLKYCKEMAKKYPSLRTELSDIYDMTADTCQEEGVSETNECELAENEIKDLVAQYEADIDAELDVELHDPEI